MANLKNSSRPNSKIRSKVWKAKILLWILMNIKRFNLFVATEKTIFKFTTNSKRCNQTWDFTQKLHLLITAMMSKILVHLFDHDCVAMRISQLWTNLHSLVFYDFLNSPTPPNLNVNLVLPSFEKVLVEKDSVDVVKEFFFRRYLNWIKTQLGIFWIRLSQLWYGFWLRHVLVNSACHV